MKNSSIKTIAAFLLISFTSCSQANKKTKESESGEVAHKKVNTEPHRYGGWYCPDNLNGFPAVDITNWKNVPVVNGRMATKEETQNGTSLIFVDTEKYPNASALDITMPKLATHYCRSTRRIEPIIIIQAIRIGNDSLVGFRYLNGGNGSARLGEITLLNEEEINKITKGKFVSLKIEIDAKENVIWEVMKNPKYAQSFEKIIDKDKELNKEWRKNTNLNFHYHNAGKSTASFADKHYGAYYIQNDYNKANYTDKFFLYQNESEKYTLDISCGPFLEDFEEQKEILTQWSEEVKRLSEEK